MTEFTDLLDLAAERLGGAVMAVNDEFFAPGDNLLRATKPVFRAGEYTDRGKWMDGWETRRRRTPGFDWAIVRLGLPGIVRGVVIDTSFFRGNYPEDASIEGCAARPDATVDELLSDATPWSELLPKSALRGDSENLFTIDHPLRVSHLRLKIFPDGGVARLRVHGDVLPDWNRVGGDRAEIDLAAAEHGGVAVACNDMFFGARNNMIMPGRAVNMGDGWETRRKRVPGHDWAVVRLCAEGKLTRVEVDTAHFKGNFPESFSLEGCCVPGLPTVGPEALPAGDVAWVEVLPRHKLQAHTRHFFDGALRASGPFTHVRLNIYPDGGVSRLRVHGHVTPTGLAALRLQRLNALQREAAIAELGACCGASRWTAGMADRRPFANREELLRAADEVWQGLGAADWHEAFRCHPRIGERKAASVQSEIAQAWSTGEQSKVVASETDVKTALAEGNRAYEVRFGYIFIVCAAGRTADEILAILQTRFAHSADEELPIAAAEQHAITLHRLERYLGS